MPEDGRVSIPLRMLDGNLAALLENEIECHHIGLRVDPETDNGVILTVRMTEEQKEAARAKGFTTTPAPE